MFCLQLVVKPRAECIARKDGTGMVTVSPVQNCLAPSVTMLPQHTSSFPISLSDVPSVSNSNGVGSILGSGISVVRLVNGVCTGSDKLPITKLTSTVKASSCRTEKRTAHNAIEKRYRLSINDRIIELRNLISGPDSKVSSFNSLLNSVTFQHTVIAGGQITDSFTCDHML
jgi:Helix-loop-helix DNA-binding domain